MPDKQEQEKPIEEAPETVETTTTETTTATTPRPFRFEDVLFPAHADMPLPTITDADKEAFFKSFLKDKSYIEEVKLFNGKFKIRFKALSLPEAAAIKRQIKMDLEGGQVPDVEYMTKIRLYRLAVSIAAIEGKAFAPTYNVDLPDNLEKGVTFVALKTKKLSDWQEAKMSAIIDAHIDFERKVFEMSRQVRNPDFWPASTQDS